MSTLTVYSIDDAQRLVTRALTKLGSPKIAYVGQRACDVFMFTPFVKIDLVISLDSGETGIHTISLEQKIGKKDLWYSTQLAKLLETNEIANLITATLPPGSLIIPYASFAGLEDFCTQNGYILLGQNSKSRSLFENKARLVNLKRKLELPCTSELIPKENAQYSTLSAVYGPKFVIQNPLGSSGTGTFIIENCGDIAHNFTQLSETVIVSAFHEGVTVSANFVITDNHILQVSPSIQVVSQPELSVYKSTFCGVDYPLYEQKVSCYEKGQIREIVCKVATEMKNTGYRGVANANILLQGMELTDINARFMGSGLLTIQSQLSQNVIPLSLVHLMQFLKIDFVLSEDVLDSYNKPLNTSMIVVHSLTECPDIALNAPLFRIFFEGSVLDNSGRLLPKYQSIHKEYEHERF